MSNSPDERTTATAQRWGAFGMFVLSLALSIDMLVRILILKQEPRQWMDIALIWLATNLIAGIGMTASGVEPYGGKWSKSWLVLLIIVVTNSVVIMLMGMVHSVAELVTDVVTCAAGVFVSFLIFRGIYRRWERVTLGRRSREE